MRKIMHGLLIGAFLLLTIFVVACSESGSGNSNKDKNKNNEEGNEAEPEEITLRWAYQWGEEEFNENFGDKLKEKFPHITIQIQDAGTDHPDSLADLIAAKKSPDIVSVGTSEHLYQLETLGLDYNLDELIEKTDFDIDAFEPALIENMRNQDPHFERGLYGLPYNRPTWSLHYDKAVFDRLGAEYPKDGMTWEEVYELAKELTQEIDDIQYRGLHLDGWYQSYFQFSDNPIDPDTNEVLIDKSEPFKRFIQYLDDVVSIPGNYPADDPGSMFQTWGAVLDDGNIAMYPGKTNWSQLAEKENMDIVTYPVWQGYEGIEPYPFDNAWAITEPSEYKEEALEVIAYLLSEEVQIEKSQNGEGSVLKSPAVLEAFAENKPELRDKNLGTLFDNKPATGPEKRSKYADNVIWKAGVELLESDRDINDFIRILQEQAEENVRSQIESE